MLLYVCSFHNPPRKDEANTCRSKGVGAGFFISLKARTEVQRR